MKAAKSENAPAIPRGWGGHVPRWLRADDPRVKVRACIRCRADFWSAHAGHRFCPKCAEEVRTIY